MEPAQRARLVAELAPNLAAAVRLHDAGAAPAEIAASLNLPVEGVDVLLRIAEAKLEHLAAELAAGDQSESRAGGDPEIQYPTTEAGTAPGP